MADSKSGATNSQYKPGTSCHSRKWRRYPHSLGSCQETRAKLKGLQVAKDETACASKYIITVIGYTYTHTKRFFTLWGHNDTFLKNFTVSISKFVRRPTSHSEIW